MGQLLRRRERFCKLELWNAPVAAEAIQLLQRSTLYSHILPDVFHSCADEHILMDQTVDNSLRRTNTNFFKFLYFYYTGSQQKSNRYNFRRGDAVSALDMSCQDKSCALWYDKNCSNSVVVDRKSLHATEK